MEYYETEVIYQDQQAIQQDKDILLVDDVKIQIELIVIWQGQVHIILILKIQIEVRVLI